MVTWIDALSKTRKNIVGALSRVFTKSVPLTQETIEELEATLIQADVPVQLVQHIVADLEESYKGLQVSAKEVLRKILIDAVTDSKPFQWGQPEKPQTILMVGINGSGKTTTCARLAYVAQQKGLKPLLGAGDTFRAAGSDQLKLWADKIGCDVVTGVTGSDAAAVAFDAVDAAFSRHSDVVIVDTAGRMHTKQPLMEELQKVKRALAKRLPTAPHEVWIVLDASMGQNAVSQARLFHEAIPLTGVVVAKLDGSAKAGFIFSIKKELGVPVRFVGLGEGKEDLAPFDATSFVDALLGNESAYKATVP